MVQAALRLFHALHRMRHMFNEKPQASQRLLLLLLRLLLLLLLLLLLRCLSGFGDLAWIGWVSDWGLVCRDLSRRDEVVIRLIISRI